MQPPTASAQCTSSTTAAIAWRLSEGFQSDVQAAVTLDAEGNVSAVEILSQAETDSLGGQCVNPEFTSQYQGAAPFTLAGKSYTVTDPLTGIAYAAAGAAEEQPRCCGGF